MAPEQGRTLLSELKALPLSDGLVRALMPQIPFSPEEQKIPIDRKISPDTCWGTDCFALILPGSRASVIPVLLNGTAKPRSLCTSGLQWPEEALDRDFSPCPAEPRLQVAEATGKPAQGWWSCHEMLGRPGSQQWRESPCTHGQSLPRSSF